MYVGAFVGQGSARSKGQRAYLTLEVGVARLSSFQRSISIASAIRSRVSNVGFLSSRSTNEIIAGESPDFWASTFIDIPISSRCWRKLTMTVEAIKSRAEGFDTDGCYACRDLTHEITIVNGLACSYVALALIHMRMVRKPLPVRGALIFWN
jgi:hypothetical protein